MITLVSTLQEVVNQNRFYYL